MVCFETWRDLVVLKVFLFSGCCFKFGKEGRRVFALIVDILVVFVSGHCFFFFRDVFSISILKDVVPVVFRKEGGGRREEGRRWGV